jgi:hypothetical protein
MIGTMLEALGGTAYAASDALVEDFSAPRPGLEAMDYLNAGQTVRLGVGERLVLNYLRSCSRETIVGGVVAIGAGQSTVSGGTVTREMAECNGGKGLLTAAQSANSGVMVFRGGLRRTAPPSAN